jgi:hypothetical protein
MTYSLYVRDMSDCRRCYCGAAMKDEHGGASFGAAGLPSGGDNKTVAHPRRKWLFLRHSA